MVQKGSGAQIPPCPNQIRLTRRSHPSPEPSGSRVRLTGQASSRKKMPVTVTLGFVHDIELGRFHPFADLLVPWIKVVAAFVNVLPF